MILSFIPAFFEGAGQMIILVPSLIVAGYIVSLQTKSNDKTEKLFGAGFAGFICMFAVSYFAVSHAETNWIYVILGMVGSVFSLLGGYIGVRTNNAH